MLRPDDRQNLLAALRPPDGYDFDCAVGTTFSLDLLALLGIPLTFTLFDPDGEDARSLDDPILLLEALREYAGRLAIFCQAGQIAVPSAHQLLYSFLEQSVHEVVPRSTRGVFHPKVWAIRFVQTAAADPVCYRLLCLSRNLTFDRSWDTMLVLDGELTDRTYAFGDNHPLGDFFAALPSLAVRAVPEKTQHMVDLIEYELRRVRFEPPPDFTELSFHPFGIKQGDRWPFNERMDRALVVSPFVVPGFLQRIGQDCGDITLISRLDTLSSLSADELSPCQSLYVLDPAAETASEEVQEEGTVKPESEFRTMLSGLHAKLYLFEQGWHAQLWTGSANATTAAFHHNVEFMVRLKGKRSRIGIDKLLAQRDDQTTLKDMLKSFVSGDETSLVDPLKELIEGQATNFQKQLASLPLTATIFDPIGDGQLYRVSLNNTDHHRSLKLPNNMELYAWPITLTDGLPAICSLSDDSLVQFSLSLEALTSFFAFEIRAPRDELVVRKRFVLNVYLENPPSGRQERIVRRLLADRQRVVRYLLMLLATEDEAGDLVKILLTRNGQENGARPEQVAFLEPLIRTLARDPEKLDRVAKLIRDLAHDPGGLELLPEGFLAIWEPIWEARQILIKEQSPE